MLPDIIESEYAHNVLARAAMSRADSKLISTFSSSRRSFCITDPTLPDNAIVYASSAFMELTGYTNGEIMGRNCRFLQGPRTDTADIDTLRKGIEDGVDASVVILNYKKDGTPFWNHVYVAAVQDINHNVTNYIGMQVQVHSPIPKQSPTISDHGDSGVSSSSNTS